jgi:hypothetical protein
MRGRVVPRISQSIPSAERRRSEGVFGETFGAITDTAQLGATAGNADLLVAQPECADDLRRAGQERCDAHAGLLSS